MSSKELVSVGINDTSAKTGKVAALAASLQDRFSMSVIVRPADAEAME